MDTVFLRNRIAGDKDSILTLVENLGYTQISDKGSYITFPRLDGDNPMANVLYVESLKWTCYTRNQSGDIFTLIMNTNDCSLPKAIRYVAKTLNIKDSKLSHITAPFGGFYHKLCKNYLHTEDDDYVYPESILDEYDGLSYRFFQQGIDYKTQEQFEICFNHKDNAIGMPIRNLRGDLIGVKMRNNDANCDMHHRFWSTYNYTKTGVLYGLYQNYQSIIENDTIIICEAEKSVLIAAAFGCHNVVAIGGHNISPSQARIIKSLMVKKIVIAFDEGVGEETTKEECEKLLVDTAIYKSKVYYLFDEENKILKKGSKDSPFDVGLDNFKALMKQKIRVK